MVIYNKIPLTIGTQLSALKKISWFDIEITGILNPISYLVLN